MALAATHFVVDGSQHPPLVHTLLAQHASPVTPQGTHDVPLQTSPPPHALPLPTHVLDVGSQHTVLAHAPPAQQGSVAAPQVTHAVPLHT